MSNFQKYARFHLIVVLAAIIAVLTLYLIPATSQGYLAGFSILGLLGFGEFYFRRSNQTPIADERDQQINQRSLMLAYTAFWICFVGWGVATTMAFSADGVIPIGYVEPVVLVAWCVVTLVHSTAVLTLSRQEA